MTAQTLRELEAKATEGPWATDFSDAITVKGGDGARVAIVTNLSKFTRRDTNEVEANAELIAYLRNHAKDFIRLMEAAEVMCGQKDGDDLEAEAKMLEALAAFKEQS